MSKLWVGWVFLIVFPKKVGHKYLGQVGQMLMSIPIKVYIIPNMVMA